MHWQQSLLISLSPFGGCIVGFLHWKRMENLRRAVLAGLLFSYLLAVFSLTFLPLPLTLGEIREYQSWPVLKEVTINIIPFMSILEIVKVSHAWKQQVFGNILLFLPFGILIPAFFKKLDSYRNIFVGVLILSTGIETIQFLLDSIFGYRYRVVDIDDIILNVAGALIGYFLWRAYKRIVLRMLQ
jgi:glycopeptide antibiotics resistance protein